MSITQVALLGADGRLGPSMLGALISAEFKVTVLKRESSKSKSTYPAAVHEIRIPDDFSHQALVQALKGQDAVVVTIPGSKTEVQKKLADAAVEAGVQRFIPADFGSCDSSSSRAQELVPLYAEKSKMRQYLQELASQHDSFTWTALVCGHFFDYDPAFLHLDINARKADILDDGNIKASASTLAQTAKGVVKILQKAVEQKTKNRTLYIQSFCMTQNEIVKAFEKATDYQWQVTKLDSNDFIKEHKAKLDQGGSDALEDLVWALGTLEANWETSDEFAMTLLGLEEEDLYGTVKRLIR